MKIQPQSSPSITETPNFPGKKITASNPTIAALEDDFTFQLGDF